MKLEATIETTVVPNLCPYSRAPDAGYAPTSTGLGWEDVSHYGRHMASDGGRDRRQTVETQETGGYWTAATVATHESNLEVQALEEGKNLGLTAQWSAEAIVSGPLAPAATP